MSRFSNSSFLLITIFASLLIEYTASLPIKSHLVATDREPIRPLKPNCKPDSVVNNPEFYELGDDGSIDGDMLSTSMRDGITRTVDRWRRGRVERRKRTSAIKAEIGRLWPHAIIPYEIHSSIETRYRRNIQRAIDQWQQVTCIRFLPRLQTSEHALGLNSSLRIQGFQETGCSSFVGQTGGDQVLRLGTRCRRSIGSIVHELGHVIGFLHEQSRRDRDFYVDIKYSNIRNDRMTNFEMYPLSHTHIEDAPYDVGSIMHYGPKAFSKNNQITISSRDPDIQSWMGQRNGPSFIDIMEANKLYMCNSSCSVQPVCHNGGYSGPMCTCICPEGLTGKSCDQVVTSDTGCGGVLSSLSGEITSPNYPETYGYNQNCFWAIQAQDNSSIRLTFETFEVEDDVNCAYDFLEIRVYGAHAVGKRFCNRGPSAPVEYTGSTPPLHFKSDDGFDFRGFSATYFIERNY